MEENKIRINRNEDDLYRINIADDGTEIVFDLADIGLGIKCNNAFNEVEDNVKKTNTVIEMINKKYVNQEMNETLKRQKETAILKAWNDMYNKNREIMDKLFGFKGAMQKLFGDANYIEMYNDLFEQLEPHFKKMELNVEKIKERLEKKYGNKNNSVIK
ncbi:MAG: hypothetical protein IJH31_01815 [Erysipelotrichaceae bacterium]|nr:hypothetical protein [Erysipelotrichaceae bacterium]